MAGNSPFVKAFNCPSCGAAQTIHAFGQSLVYACGACGASIDISKEPFSILKSAQEVKAIPDIPLGTRGKIGDDLWEVIGFMIRSDSTGQYSWNEYLLFNPYNGFRWLMQMDGHWNYIEPVSQSPIINDSTAVYDGRSYQLFLKDSARVDFVLGEFYWRVKVGDKVTVKDYISPPYVLSEEIDGSERVCSRGIYVEPREIEAAFNISLRTTFKSGVFPNQPAPFENSASFIYSICGFFIALLIASQIAFTSTAAKHSLFQSSFKRNLSDPVKSHISPQFEIPYEGNVEFRAFAPVDNSWVEVGFELVDTATQTAVGDAVEVSFYHGNDSDGSWTEGGQSNSTVIGSVPAGNYQLEIEPSLDPKLTSVEFAVTAIHDVPYHGNFGVAFFLMLIPAAVVLISRGIFNKRRWENSDFN